MLASYPEALGTCTVATLVQMPDMLHGRCNESVSGCQIEVWYGRGLNGYRHCGSIPGKCSEFRSTYYSVPKAFQALTIKGSLTLPLLALSVYGNEAKSLGQGSFNRSYRVPIQGFRVPVGLIQVRFRVDLIIYIYTYGFRA